MIMNFLRKVKSLAINKSRVYATLFRGRLQIRFSEGLLVYVSHNAIDILWNGKFSKQNAVI
jgi:hypothetical protein